MSWQIIKQPNKKYCVYSTVVDHFVVVDATEEELKDFYKEERGRQCIHAVEEVLKKIDDDILSYFQFTMSFEEAIQNIKDQHGEFKLEFENSPTMLEKDFYES